MWLAVVARHTRRRGDSTVRAVPNDVHPVSRETCNGRVVGVPAYQQPTELMNAHYTTIRHSPCASLGVPHAALVLRMCHDIVLKKRIKQYQIGLARGEDFQRPASILKVPREVHDSIAPRSRRGYHEIPVYGATAGRGCVVDFCISL